MHLKYAVESLDARGYTRYIIINVKGKMWTMAWKKKNPLIYDSYQKVSAALLLMTRKKSLSNKLLWKTWMIHSQTHQTDLWPPGDFFPRPFESRNDKCFMN